MFPNRLSDATAADVQAIFDTEVSEGLDVEFKRSLPSKDGADAWMSGGRIGDEAKDHLAREIIAFANTDGGTLILGIDEDKQTKRAILPMWPLPRCKEAANNLHQSISQRAEPRLPSFECEGVVTEPDGSSGVIVMRVLPSYLAPHRHGTDRHCYVRRNDRAEQMSMAEIQDQTKRMAKGAEEVDRAFVESSNRFFDWIPAGSQRTHPVRGVMGEYREGQGGSTHWAGAWALRITARPFGPLPVGNLSRQAWVKLLDSRTFTGGGRQGLLQNIDLGNVRPWKPRLRATERTFEGDNLSGLDRVTADGQIDRLVFRPYVEQKRKQRPSFQYVSLSELMWNMASVIHFADVIRSQLSRPSQSFALEVELLQADPLYLIPYPGPAPPGSPIISEHRILFPRYEIGSRETFDDLMTVFDQDLWNSAGFQSDWKLSVDWPRANN